MCHTSLSTGCASIAIAVSLPLGIPSTWSQGKYLGTKIPWHEFSFILLLQSTSSRVMSPDPVDLLVDLLYGCADKKYSCVH